MGRRALGRREFITLLGGAAALGRSRRARSSASGSGASACSLPGPPRTIRKQVRNAAFLQGLQQLGWIVGRNVRIDYRWARPIPTISQLRGGIGRARAGRHPRLWRRDRGAVAAGHPHRADRVCDVADPVGAGFVDSLARPGGNATGFMGPNTWAGNGSNCSKRSRRA